MSGARPPAPAGRLLGPTTTTTLAVGFPGRSEAPGGVWWTGRYSNPRIAESGLAPVRITVGYPRFRLRYELAATIRELEPSRASFHLSDEAFTAWYRARLEVLGVDALRDIFEGIRRAAGADPVLLCFEDVQGDPSARCHRRVFADWWEERTGQPVLELDEGGGG